MEASIVRFDTGIVEVTLPASDLPSFQSEVLVILKKNKQKLKHTKMKKFQTKQHKSRPIQRNSHLNNHIVLLIGLL